MDRSHPGHGGADGDPGHGVLGKRRGEHPVFAEPFNQATGGALNGLVVIHVEPHDENLGVAGHFLLHGLAQRIDV